MGSVLVYSEMVQLTQSRLRNCLHAMYKVQSLALRTNTELFEGPMSINGTGNPHLAQGGSGDVLAGHLGGWLARADLESTADAICAQAVWRHGAAADRLATNRNALSLEALITVLAGDFDC